jgi:hypothetical protein
MPKVLSQQEGDKTLGYFFDCPGCQGGHFVTIKPFRAANGASWTFDGDLEWPTFNPSVLSRVEPTDGGKAMICHLFVRAGVIEFLPDCTHPLAGQKVRMVDV